MPHTFWLACCLALATVSTTTPALPQHPKDRPADDPYTRGDTGVMLRAGVAGYAPFRFGQHCTAAEVQVLLRDEPLLWLETAHFRIGAALPELELPPVRPGREGAAERPTRAQLRRELEALAARLPNVRSDPRKLDPWLRLHLIAQRAEAVHGAVQDLLGCSDTDFPAAPGDNPRQPQQYRGRGPYLGNPEKFTILLVQRNHSLQRFTAAYHGRATTQTGTYHDHAFGTALFAASLEADGGRLQDDTALRAVLAFHVAHNLYTSYRAYNHELPPWLLSGLAHRHARAASTQHAIYDLRGGDDPEGKHYAAWEKRWPYLLREQRPGWLPAFLARWDGAAFTADDHLLAWALVDHLASQQPKALREFLDRLKAPFHGRVRFPTQDELQSRQQEALLAAFGGDALALEAAWRRRVQPVAKR